jgi:hypothetical protein
MELNLATGRQKTKNKLKTCRLAIKEKDIILFLALLNPV